MRKVLLRLLSVVLSLGLFLEPLDITNASSIEAQSNKDYATSSVVEVAKTLEENKEEQEQEEHEENNSSDNNNDNSYEDYHEDYYQPEVTGNRIRVGGVDKPLMKDYSGDNFYLNHNIYGEYDGLGVPYIDFRTDFYTRKTIIYAHSSTMGNGPFQALQNYHNNQWYFENNRYITIEYEGNTYTYEIFSVYVSLANDANDEGLEYFYRMNYSDPDWENRIEWYKNNSEYDTGVSVSGNDRILILQTCSMDPAYYEQYYRYNLLIMGKLI